MDPVGFTSRLTAAARARETERPDHLFNDEFAAALAGQKDSTSSTLIGSRLAEHPGRPLPCVLAFLTTF
jgi:O-methyltransferase involved in polyketide biosynthesis